ncbi:MAG: DNA repair exonuclease [Oscillospiraceae bacterium]|nr:DNA repair exonuclease [Oscillospiraceae bacterium]
MRIIHGADFHLDAPFDGLSPQQAAQRRAEQRQLLERLASLAQDFQAQAVLLAGDLLDGERVYAETVETLTDILGRIEIPVLIAPGNHDPFTSVSPYARTPWPDNVTIFSSGTPRGVKLPGCGAVVYGAAFTAPHQEESLLKGFSAPDDDLVHLMVLHGQVNGTPEGGYNPIDEEEITASNLDYLALGHVHQYSGLCRSGAVPWAYCGCPEGRGFDELGLKGVLCIQVEKGHAPQVEFVPLCARQYRILRLPVTPEDSEESIVAQIQAQAASEDLVRIILTGESSDKSINLTEIENKCRSRGSSLSLRDETRVTRGLWERAEEDNLTGLFLRCLQAKLSAAVDEEEAELVQMAARFGLAALEHREDWAV